MTTHRLFTILPLLFISNILSASAAPPPELTILRQQYEKVFAERVTAVHETAIADLDAKFTIALDNALAQAKGAGDLQTALAIQADQKLLAEHSPIPDDAPITPESLRKIRAIYREQLSTLIEQRNANAATLQDPYTSKLKDLETTLTKADRLEEAKEVFDYRISLRAEAPPAVVVAPAMQTLAATGPVKGGTLKGAGQFLFGNQPVDLSNAEGITDFVQVEVNHMGWIARRANGDVHFQIQAYENQTRGVWSDKRAILVRATEGKPMFAVFDDGTARAASTYNDHGELPANVTDVVDIDAVTGVFVFLHRDHTVSFAGAEYPAIAEKKWFPGSGELKDVAAIACGRYDLHVLFNDGSLRLWHTKSGEVEVPRPISKDLRTIAAGNSKERLAAITNRGRWLTWDGKNEPATRDELSSVRCGGLVAIFRGTDDEWKLPKTGTDDWMKLLTPVLPSRKWIDLDVHHMDNSADGKDVSRVILWVEPVP